MIRMAIGHDDDDDVDGHDTVDYAFHHNHCDDEGSEEPCLLHPGWNSGHLPTQPAAL